MKALTLEKAFLEARKLAQAKLAMNENADEFVEIGNTDYFKKYVAAAKPLMIVLPAPSTRIQGTYSCK